MHIKYHHFIFYKICLWYFSYWNFDISWQRLAGIQTKNELLFSFLGFFIVVLKVPLKTLLVLVLCSFFSLLKIFLRVKISFVVIWKFPLLQRESFYTKCDIANFEVRIRSKTAVERYYQVSPKYAFNIFHLRILDFLDSPKTPHRQYWILLQNNRNRLSLPSVIDQKFSLKKVQTRFQAMTLSAWLIFPTAILQGAFHVSTWQYITLSRNKKEMIFLWSPNTQHREGKETSFLLPFARIEPSLMTLPVIFDCRTKSYIAPSFEVKGIDRQNDLIFIICYTIFSQNLY